jgi:hypothetical protein
MPTFKYPETTIDMMCFGVPKEYNLVGSSTNRATNM